MEKHFDVFFPWLGKRETELCSSYSKICVFLCNMQNLIEALPLLYRKQIPICKDKDLFLWFFGKKFENQCQTARNITVYLPKQKQIWKSCQFCQQLENHCCGRWIMLKSEPRWFSMEESLTFQTLDQKLRNYDPFLISLSDDLSEEFAGKSE